MPRVLECPLHAKSGHSHCSKIFLCSHGLQTQDLSEILEWRFHSALFLACDGRLLQIELALDAPARLVGNFALAQQPVDEFTLGGNQVGSEFPDSRSSFEPLRWTSRQPSHTIVMPGTQDCQNLGCNSALGRKS